MTAFLTELGKRLAEKWFTLLVLPGLLFIGTAWVGTGVLGNRHWNDVTRLRTTVTSLAGTPAAHSSAVLILVAAGVLGGSAAAGLAAQVVGRVIERLWLGAWPAPLARPLCAYRRTRWTRADQRYRQALAAKVRRKEGIDGADKAEPDTAALNAARNRIAWHEPRRPTWIGDRILAVDSRLYRSYDLDLSSAWSPLWLLLPESTSSALQTTKDQFDSATGLAAWGVLYTILGIWWWPALIVGAITIITAWTRGRAAMDAYARLVEAAVDLHGRDLAASLGIDCPGRLTRDVGLAITRCLRKGV